MKNLKFGVALAAMEQGHRIARAGWIGKGMYLWLLPAANVKAEWCREPHLKEVAEANGGEIEALGSIRMMTADRKILTGWLASQEDMLAGDWEILDGAGIGTAVSRSLGIRAKMRCSVAQENPDYDCVRLDAVDAGSEENRTFALATPTATLHISISNPEARGKFVEGEEYYVDFTQAN